jgi:UDP-N-acetylmuramate dehydrogenase
MKIALDQPLTAVSLDQLTTFGIGGPAQLLFCPSSIASLANYLKNLEPSLKKDLCWLGLGSNVLVSDEGLVGPVILSHKGLAVLELRAENTVYVEAGVPCAKLARLCASAGLANSAFFAGIPGTVGGALAMNAGAWGGETWQQVLSVSTIDEAGNLHHRSPDEYHIDYRTIKLKSGLNSLKEWFVSAVLQFPAQKQDPDVLSKIIVGFLKQRAASQPIGTRNCGSVFRNPPGAAAGKLIESLGFKGFQVGNIQVSPKHANFIINLGKGRAIDVLSIIKTIQEAVNKEYKIILEPELRFLGLDTPV